MMMHINEGIRTGAAQMETDDDAVFNDIIESTIETADLAFETAMGQFIASPENPVGRALETDAKTDAEDDYWDSIIAGLQNDDEL